MQKILSILALLSGITWLSAEDNFDPQIYFNHDLHISSWPGTNNRMMICLHGYGDNYTIGANLKQIKLVETAITSFNFPEYDIKKGREYDYNTASFGTINELLPALYVLKHIILHQGWNSIDLYGFSAGGGALINVLKVLNTSTYDQKLNEIGIGIKEKQQLLEAIQKGIVILDTPLKSIEEIIDFRGTTEELEILAKNYRDNHFTPIDSIEFLKGLSLDIILHFQQDDEVLSNRDDLLFIEKLQTIQPNTIIIKENDGGHMTNHMSLWKAYFSKSKNNCKG